MSPEIPKGQTLLTMPLSAEAEAIKRARDRELEQARTLIYDVVLKAYGDGEVTLEWSCRTLHRGLLRFDDPFRQRALGAFLEAALDLQPPKRGRGNKGQPRTVRALAVGLAGLARDREGLTLQREHKDDTAFEFAARVLAEWNLSITPRQIEDWWQAKPQPPK